MSQFFDIKLYSENVWQRFIGISKAIYLEKMTFFSSGKFTDSIVVVVVSAVYNAALCQLVVLVMATNMNYSKHKLISVYCTEIILMFSNLKTICENMKLTDNLILLGIESFHLRLENDKISNEINFVPYFILKPVKKVFVCMVFNTIEL
ncbi:hypothetical protein BpHYR1_024891 [Brachionus plicatilis]|uniref:Uncharacterized protein n=1 Tax=Brachionus plicatilis TaxID=10195 RepID=A0A3M7PG75_BRAPC|nr:hypothetical protein BpHYR1_024891 [Brachionus plicatilis]